MLKWYAKRSTRGFNILEINPEENVVKSLRVPGWNPVEWPGLPVHKPFYRVKRTGRNSGDQPHHSTSVKKSGFYGWPYAYFGRGMPTDPRGWMQ